MWKDAGQDKHDTAARLYGVLATSLNEALGEARQALEPHADLLPTGRLDELDTVLAELARRRVRLAIYGEVKAGKSTLLDAIAGAELSPVAFDPLTSVPVRVTYGPRTTWRVADRVFENVEELSAVMRQGVTNASEVAVETNLDLLQLGGQVDLLDTPGVGSDERYDEISATTLRSLDAVVLVVRYPALFTQFTRGLMKELEQDISKLFVVWNLDADCAELTEEERVRHAETLRTNVAGAHELFLVDARAGLRASQAGDAAARTASGLDGFIEALGRFASSEKREVAALREAAKRADHWLEEAQRILGEREAWLDAALSETRARLRSVQAAGDQKAREARTRFAELQAAVVRIGEERAAAATAHAARLAKRLRAGRRRWMWNGKADALETAIAAAAEAYANEVEANSRAAVEALRDTARRFGADISSAPRPRAVPTATPLAPDERITRATDGSVQLLRRTVWRRWYLPGLTALEQKGIAADLASRTSWFDATAQDAERAAHAVIDSRLAEISRQADAELEQIKVETNFTADEAEIEGLRLHVLAVAAQRENVARINREARALIT